MKTDTLILLAQAAEPVQGSGGPLDALMKSGMLFPIGIIIMMYFLLIRPQQKQKKELAAKIAGLKKGDKIVTTGGIHGMVNHKSDTTISLKVSEGVFIKMESTSVATVLSSSSSTEGKEEESKDAEEKK